jgi:hypothetical protein
MASLLGEGVGGAVAGYLARHALDAVNRWVAAGAGWLLTHAGRALEASSRPELGTAWFAGHYRVMLELAAVVAVPLLLVSAIQAIVRQDPGQLMRNAFIYLPFGLLLGAMAVELARLGVEAVDTMSASLANDTGLHVRGFLASLGPPSRLAALTGSGALPAFVVLAILFILALGALLLWLELVVRSAAIEVAVLFVPLVLAGLVWPATAAWARRLAETLGALVVAKLVIVAVLVLAASALLRPGSGAGPAAVVEGTALLILAVASPFAILRMVPLVEAGSVAHLEGSGRLLARRAASAVARPARLAAPALLGGAGADLEAPGGSAWAEPSGTAALPWADAPWGWELPPDGLGEAGGPGGSGAPSPGGDHGPGPRVTGARSDPVITTRERGRWSGPAGGQGPLVDQQGAQVRPVLGEPRLGGEGREEDEGREGDRGRDR